MQSGAGSVELMMKYSPEGQVTTPHLETSFDKRDQSFILANSQHGAQQETLSVDQLRVHLHLGVVVIVLLPHHLTQGIHQASRLLAESVDGCH